jgi:hypothetical protein
VHTVRILSPYDGYVAPAVAEGYTNLAIRVNVTNASANAPAVGAQALLVLDNGTSFSIPAYGPGNYSILVADYREGTHSYTVFASLPGCIDDSVTQYYYYQKGIVRSAPDFNPLLAPLAAAAMLFVARTRKGKPAKKK